jgi:hypothetical protein
LTTSWLVSAVDSQLREVLAERPEFGLLHRIDETLGRCELLVLRFSEGELRHEVTRELDREVEYELVSELVPLFPPLGALALGEVVAKREERTLRAASRFVGQALVELSLAEASLGPKQVHLLQIGRHRVELDVRSHADTLDRNVARREVLGDRELQRRTAGDVREHQLNRTFAERPLPDDDGAIVVLQRT